MAEIHRELVKLYQDFNIQFNQSNEIMISTQEQLNAIKMVKDVPEANFRIESQTELVLGKKISVYVERPHTQTGLLVSPNLTKLIETRPLTPPKNYYLIESKEASFIEKSDMMQSYELIAIFLGKIQGGSIIFNEIKNKITFIGNKINLVLPITYSVNGIENNKINLALEKLDKLLDESEKDKEQLNSILAEEIVYMLQFAPKENALNIMISHLDNLIDCTYQHYKSYKADFSYKKFLDEVRKNHLENYTKLHKVFSDIQAHLIGIPIASFISATQIKKAIEDSSDFRINILIIISILIYLIFTYLAVSNQTDTLENIKFQIKNQKEKLLQCLEEKDVAETYAPLDNRVKKQAIILRFMKIVIIASGIGCTLFYFEQVNSLTPILDKLSYWCNQLFNFFN